MSPATKASVLSHIANLERAIAELREHQGATPQELRRDLSRAWAIQHGLQLAIQNVIDISARLLADRGIRDLDEYAQVPSALGDHELMPQEFVSRIVGMAGFRNILVHEYAKVDLKTVCQVLNSRLDDFGEFARLARGLLPD